jgi:predicted ester cyclase
MQRTTEDLVASLLALWQQPPEGPDEARAAFAGLYTDPVELNGVATPLSDLIDRARWLEAALEDIRFEIVEQVAVGEVVVVSFIVRAMHTGPFLTPIGVVPATGRHLVIRATDVLTLRDGRIVRVTVVSDDLGALANLGLVSLATTR